MSEYQPVPVFDARDVAHRRGKDVIVIVAWDAKSNLLHFTSYGRDVADKQSAANLSAIIAQAIGADFSKLQKFEDFRDRTKAEWAKSIEELTMALSGVLNVPEALKALTNWGPSELIAARAAIAASTGGK